MLFFWSPKGGSGTTVTAALVASQLARTSHEVLLVDLGGDVPAVAGLPEPPHGVTDWLAAEDPQPAALSRLEAPTSCGVTVLGAGSSSSWPEAAEVLLVGLLGAEDRPVVIDGGRLSPQGDLGRLQGRLAAVAHPVMVLRPCYLALRRAMSASLPASSLVVVGDGGRALDAVDVADVLARPVVASVDLDPAVARVVDAGLLFDRPPRAALRQLRKVADGVGGRAA